MGEYALVDGDDINFPEDESITEDDTANATLEVKKLRIGTIACGMTGTYQNYKFKVKRKQMRENRRRRG